MRVDREAFEKAEKELIEALTRMGIVSPGFSGDVILHLSQGGLTDIDRFEKCIRRRLGKTRGGEKAED